MAVAEGAESGTGAEGHPEGERVCTSGLLRGGCSAAARRMFQRISLLTAATYALAELTTTSVSEPDPENFRDVV